MPVGKNIIYIFDMRYLKIVTLLLIISQQISAQKFDDFFADSTLRLDYIFSGNKQAQNISLSQMFRLPRWYGKKQRLADVPVEGNGQVIVRSHKTGKVIYRNSFSTLFQEWLSYPEAGGVERSFENVFLVPFPKDTVDITVQLPNNRREVMVSYTHVMTPEDILVRHIGEKRVTPYETLHAAKDTARCIHIAFLAEGYMANEMDVFMADARTAMDALFEHEPFKSCKERFNLVAVKAESEESGTSMPGKGVWKDTPLHSHFDTFYSPRYLTTLHLSDMHDMLAGTPYEHIIVLVNTDNYGGGGILNSYNLSMTHHPLYRPVVVHEFGHSFAGLADEYAYEEEVVPMYPHDVEPWERNITTLVDFNGKWETMLHKDTPVPTSISDEKYNIGVYEGAGYNTKGVYRGSRNCRMRTNEYPEFCKVCEKSLQDVIDFYTVEAK